MLIDVSKLTSAGVFDLVTVGHFAIDTILARKITQPKSTLGGPPTYVSVAAAKLGAKVSVVSKVGDDFPEEFLRWLQNNHVDLSGLKRVSNTSTTRFVLEYEGLRRKMRLEARAPSILPRDVSDSLRAKAVHVAPIANELSSAVVSKLRKSAKVLSLDPQGFVRSFDDRGNVVLKGWRELEVLAQIDVFKSSAEEVQAVAGTRSLKLAMRQVADYGPRLVLITRGVRGSGLLFEDSFYSIPLCKPRILVDPTGAGDAFVGAFLAEYARGKDVLWCACVGSGAASFVVEAVGPERFGGRHEVYERANKIYGKVVGKK